VLQAFSEILLAYRRSREPFEIQQVGLGKDRRIFLRVSLQIPCSIANPMFGLESPASTVDASLEGVGVLAPVNWSQGSRIRVKLEAISFEADGIIVFRREESPHFRYGVRFQSTALLQLLKLRRLLKKSHGGRLSA
jgi:hypothetical protein